MRYSKEHKQETHARIVRKASVRLREKGAHGIGVADLMKEAGLTHGGFYAHFDSRDALVIEAFNYAMDRSTERWRKLAEQTPPEKRLAAIVESYLTTVHRDDPGFSVGPKERKLGIKGSPTCEIYFEDCTIPADRIIGEPGTGFRTALATLDHTRLTIGAQALGIAQGAIDASIAYVKPLSRWSFAMIASLSSAVPPTGVYFVLPCFSAATAASLMWSCVSKSGSPAPKSMTSRPSRRSAATFTVTMRVGDGLISCKRFARFIGFSRSAT